MRFNNVHLLQTKPNFLYINYFNIHKDLIQEQFIYFKYIQIILKNSQFRTFKEKYVWYI